jgi:SAM-dependent methyltransferase
MKFDAKAARRLEATYSTPDVVGQRAQTLEVLRPRAGESGLDIGCGPGLLAVDLARQMGPTGRIFAIDTSPDMVAMASGRTQAEGLSDRIAVLIGDAAELPFRDGTFDFLVATQVYEYVPDMKKALAEAARVLRPGGRLAVLDTDWESCVWNAEDRERNARILRAWERHFVHPHLPAELPRLLADAGLTLRDTRAIPILNLRCDADTYSSNMIETIARFVAARGGISEAEARAWSADLRAQAEHGTYFFSLNRYLFLAERAPE